MIKRDYYLVLGVSRSESPKGINRAFRRLAKKYHPDIVGPKWANRFREIVEAYHVLSDPEKRRHYNQGLAHGEEVPITSSPIMSGYGREPEPLVPEPVSPMHDFLSVSDSVEEILRRFERNFTGTGVPKSERPQSLTMEIVLTPYQAARGGVFLIDVPTVYPCPFCDGTGSEWPFPCIHCRGQGMIEEQETVRLRIPPGVRNDEIFDIPLQGLGIHNLYLKVRVRIGSYRDQMG